jgi:FkbM family methyltransferase
MMMMTKIRKAVRALAYARDRRALLNGVGASLEHAKVLRRLPTAGTIIDVGSNKGQFVLEAIKWHPNCQIFAFEPLTRERAVLERVLAGLPSLTVYPFALGEQDATTQMHVSSAADSSSILEQTELQAQSFPGTQNVGRDEIKIRRIDRLLDREALKAPVLCKIDVQGYELNVLRGFGSLLDAVDYLIVEVTNASFYAGAPNSAEVVAFLASKGFRILGMYNMYMSEGLCLQTDILFCRPSENSTHNKPMTG